MVKPGLYERLLTSGLLWDLRELPEELYELGKVDNAESPRVLAQHLAALTLRVMESVPPDRRVLLANEVGQLLLSEISEHGELIEQESVQQLLSVSRASVTRKVVPLRPAIPLSQTDLLVNARGEHRIGSELIKELSSADRVDLLCAFLKFSGFRLLRDSLTEFVGRGGQLRVLTTCYMGATELKALDALAELGNVKVSYEKRRTRLHAKAWLFHRETGYSTAYIGSSNMSVAALQDGLEWNVRVSRVENPRVLAKFESTFETYWQDSEFESYRAEEDRERFVRAVRDETATRYEEGFVPNLEVRAYPFQQEILERLEVEREVHGRWQNLVVAATGTGKTVMAGLDFRRLQKLWKRARLLFVAHREEILKQSLATFRAILRDGTFGELWTGVYEPTQTEHLFVSVQKLNHVDLSGLDPTHFDVVVVDEFHHAAAKTYDRLLEHFTPRLLLGLTATPERADGQSILHWFNGHIAAELRLWDALERGLLCPFQYFGIHDNTDLQDVDFQRGRYSASSLENVYTGNDARTFLILKQLESRVTDPSSMRALGFCVTVAHAELMTRKFIAAGYSAACVTGQTSRDQRRKAVSDLAKGELQIVFTVDVFNEGVDIPEVDTVLLLRPTESATVYLQQLGRGLRLCEGKECLTVLDFIGFQRKEFRFDLCYRALVGGSRKELEKQIKSGFPQLPSGCSIQLDRVAKEIVLNNVRRSIRSNKRFLKEELSALGSSCGLQEFLRRTGVELTDLYRGGKPGWVTLRCSLGFDQRELGEMELARAIARLTHVDCVKRIEFLQSFLNAPEAPRELPSDPSEALCVSMLHFSLWSAEEAKKGYLEKLSDLWRDPTALDELRALLPALRDRVEHTSYPLRRIPECPLMVHCRYSLAEILAALQVVTPDSPHRIREGVYYHEPSGCDLFFVTVQKNEKDYSPTTLYRDFALSTELFHWESQSTTRANSKAGLRYQSHRGRGGRALFFVRESAKDDRGFTRPYLFLGPAEYVQHQNEQPMEITWKLEHAIPMIYYRHLRLAG